MLKQLVCVKKIFPSSHEHNSNILCIDKWFVFPSEDNGCVSLILRKCKLPASKRICGIELCK